MPSIHNIDEFNLLTSIVFQFREKLVSIRTHSTGAARSGEQIKNERVEFYGEILINFCRLSFPHVSRI